MEAVMEAVMEEMEPSTIRHFPRGAHIHGMAGGTSNGHICTVVTPVIAHLHDSVAERI